MNGKKRVHKLSTFFRLKLGAALWKIINKNYLFLLKQLTMSSKKVGKWWLIIFLETIEADVALLLP
ncbi:MAG: hypothetical protein CL420_05345 [Acidimicrobiaceae bacterium]|nr:hypothetical protein [Acidimicrobiaceae bacterium]